MPIPARDPELPAHTAAVAAGDKADIVARVVAAIEAGDTDGGRDILRAEYPFVPVAKTARRYTERQSLRVFYRDGFLDRYSGTKLVHPGALRALSLIVPEEFPPIPTGPCRSPTSRSGSCFPPSIIWCRSPAAARTRSRTG